MNAERKIIGLVLATTATVAYTQSHSTENGANLIRYAKFGVHVNKTPTHDGYEVPNGIIVEPPDNKGGVDRSTLRFCAPDSDEWMEVPISDTDYFEKDKAIIPREERGEVSSRPFNTAVLGQEPCTLVVGNTVLRAGAQKLAMNAK